MAERMNGGVVTCTVGPSIPDGRVTVVLKSDAPREFPRDDTTAVAGGRVAITAPPGAGSAVLEMAEVTRGRVTWNGAEVGSIVECAKFEALTDLVAVHGHVLEETGEPADSAWVEGCDAHAYSDDATGEFTLFVAPGPCELRAVRGRNMGRSKGPIVAIAPSPGRDVFDVVLVAPDPPEWRDPTPEESAKSAAELCEYWSGEGTKWIALVEGIAAKTNPGTSEYEQWQVEVKKAHDSAAKSKRTFCDAE